MLEARCFYSSLKDDPTIGHLGLPQYTLNPKPYTYPEASKYSIIMHVPYTCTELTIIKSQVPSSGVLALRVYELLQLLGLEFLSSETIPLSEFSRWLLLVSYSFVGRCSGQSAWVSAVPDCLSP